MKSRLIVLLGCCYLAISTEQAFAQTNNNWKEWIDVQIKQHPRVISALEELKASRSTIKGASQPIYNPELETELEKEGMKIIIALVLSKRLILMIVVMVMLTKLSFIHLRLKKNINRL